ncbi:MAG: transcription-repair coupling factor [Fidelibacterota bacterium]
MNVSRETLSLYSFFDLFIDRVLGGRPAREHSFLGPVSFVSVALLNLPREIDRVHCVCLSGRQAEELYRFCFNLRPDSVFFFPEQPMERQDVEGFNLEYERFQSEAYNALVQKNSGLIITTEGGLQTPVKNPVNSRQEGFHLTVDADISKEHIVRTLVAWGFEPCDKVTYPKTFASRGGILDVFLLYAALPVRLEFFGNRLESLRTFNPLSQRRVHDLEYLDILPPSWDETTERENYTLQQLLQQSDEWHLRTIKQDVCLLQRGDDDNKTVIRAQRPDLNSDAHHSDVFAFSDNSQSAVRLEKLPFRSPVLVHGSLADHFEILEQNFLCLSLPVFFQRTAPDRYRWAADEIAYSPYESISAIDDIEWGDLLVHRDYGIGRYRGLKTLQQNDMTSECITIEYADGSNIYVPIDKFDKIHKFIHGGGRPPALTRLGTKSWHNLKLRVKKSTQVVVQDLLTMYANRNRSRGFCYQPNDELYEAVAQSFSFEETPDQAQAIQDVVRDMERDRPMDRLICGDVGFGKTEVAIRATIKAVASGKKVLLLTPTTILADQHFISFTSRLKPVGVSVDLLSRFRKNNEQLAVLESMLRGEVDVVIGTHRLLSQDVTFPDLGLLIVDEEHRFGVKHKETLKRLKTTVDVLTLTATPIPRTLQQSLVGIRDISKIQTPPLSRKPIHTFIKYHDWDVVARVLKAELDRGGQSYFLHNSVDTLPFVYKEVTSRIPSARVAIAYGQMRSRDLEKIVLAFFRGEIDILLCTTIIESGLDVSNANTIIIDQAHRFGLAQLYQIRGRVGRSYRQAFCYLLLPMNVSLTNDAFKRLKAIEQYTSLGSGLDIALKDLEIRGAGNLFGYKQSGNIAAVGFDLYCQILKEAVDETLGKTDSAPPPVSVVISEPALLDSEYMPQVEDRIFFYKRLSEAVREADIREIQAEIRDRFGPLPPSAQRLVAVALLRAGCRGTPIHSLRLTKTEVTVILSGFAPFSSPLEMIDALSRRLRSLGNPFSLSPRTKTDDILVSVRAGNPEAVMAVVETFKDLFGLHSP